jgi:hypothetical protein
MVTDLGDGVAGKRAGVSKVGFAQFDQTDVGLQSIADDLLDEFFTGFRVVVAERDTGVLADGRQ